MAAILLAFIFAQSATAQFTHLSELFSHLKENQCSELEKVTVPNMPIQRDQGSLGFCYGFSLTTAIDHFNCRKKKLDCSDPKNSFSSLDILSVGNEGFIKEGGNSYRLMQKIIPFGKLAKEECAPYSKYKFKNDPTFTSEESTWSHLSKVYQESHSIKNECTGLDLEPINLPIIEIYKALGKSTFSEFMSSISIPPECQANRVSLPPLSTCTFDKNKLKDDPVNLNKAIVSILKSSTPIIFDFCLDQNCEAGQGHSVIIHGFENLCCKEKGQMKCEKKYLIRDSARVLSKEPGDYWVSEDFVINKSKNYDQHTPHYDKNGQKTNFSTSFLYLCDSAQ